jgi:hypothetical protein
MAFEEVRQPRHVRGLEGSDQHRTTEAELDQRQSTQDERAQDPFAELGLGDEQGSQRLRRNNDCLHTLPPVLVEVPPVLEFLWIRPCTEQLTRGRPDHTRHAHRTWNTAHGFFRSMYRASASSRRVQNAR